MQKIHSLSYHEASKLHNSKTESLNSLSFFPINSWPGDIPSLRKNTYGITSMSPNQNISIWMAPLPREIPGTHLHIFTPSLIYLTNEDIDDMDLCDFTHDTSPTPAPPLINNEFEKEWETVWEVFPELSDNPSDPAIIPPTNPSTTHASTSTTHYSTSPSPPPPSLTSIPKPSPAPI